MSFSPQRATSFSPTGAFGPGAMQGNGVMNQGFNMPMNQGMMYGCHSAGGMVRSQLHLVLSQRLLHGSLVPGGHLAEVARACGVQIDLCQEVGPDQRQVV